MKLIGTLILCFHLTFLSFSQDQYLQLNIEGGYSLPIGKFNDKDMFAGKGLSTSLGFDYFFKSIGIGMTGGVWRNESVSLFKSHIENKFYDLPAMRSRIGWETRHLGVTLTKKLSSEKWNVDLFGNFGVMLTSIPELTYSKYFNQISYEGYAFKGQSQEWQKMWSLGARYTYFINDDLGFQINAKYLSNQYFSNISYNFQYKDVQDVNNNGVIDYGEFFESPITSRHGALTIQTINFHIGLVYLLGKKNEKVIDMIPYSEWHQIKENSSDNQMDSVVISEVKSIENDLEPQEYDQSRSTVMTTPTIYEPSEIESLNDTIIHEAFEENTRETNIAEASIYTKENAEMLYMAGEGYFTTNDFENAVICFNKLKGDPDYPMAQYMFALSLSGMGNCEEAKKEYKEFIRGYNQEDRRTLEVIFASQFERCASIKKIKFDQVNAITTIHNKVEDSIHSTIKQPQVHHKEFRIQFIAIKKPDVSFPKVAQIGYITTEFFPNKSVYRYTLTGYETLNTAIDDMHKVRTMGFNDAFIAEYTNGIRTNTLYHNIRRKK